MKNTQPLNILVVDDLEANLMVYDDLFAYMDARLLKAKSGSQALELLLEHDIGLALIDVHMPEMDGFELAELMRGSKRTANVPIIFITAGIEDRRRAFQGYDIGAVDFLFKPIEPQVLHSKVRVFVELQRQRRELEETLRLNEELLAVVSHDLRNPLNLVAVAVAVLAESADPAVVATARKIERSTRRMATILNDLLDLSRARLGGGIPIVSQECELDAIAATVVDELRPTAESAITVNTLGNLRGEWDIGRLQQVLSNLLANALCHGRPGGVVTLTLDGCQSSTVGITIHNEGTIPRGVRATMFEPFAGTATLKRRAKRDAPAGGASGNGGQDGLGLGLYIASEIVRAHGGTIEVHSSEAEGTSFEIQLPRGKHTTTA